MIISSRQVRIGLAVLAACAGAGVVAARQDPPKPIAAAPSPARTDAEKAIRGLIKGFAQAYNRKDADGVAALFTEDARVYDEAGKATEGRKAIRDRFAAAFEGEPGLTVHLEPASIRFLSDDVAVEDGVVIATPPRAEGAAAATPGPEQSSQYTALHVKRGGAWLTAEVRDRAGSAAASGLDEGDKALGDLAFLVGEWVDEDDNGAVMTTGRWTDDHKYLLRDFRVKLAGRPATSGTQRVGWDAVRQKVRSWAFDSDGGFTEGFWTRVGPDRWVIKSDGFLRDGRAVSATNTLTQVNRDAYHWSSSDRVVGDEALTDVEDVLIVRKPPAPGAKKK
jgi:uncharacterized protein (TIGR02246 family)